MSNLNKALRISTRHRHTGVEKKEPRVEYAIPDYSEVMSLIRRDAAEQHKERHYMDAAGRFYFPADPLDFPLLCALNEAQQSQPWIVVLPMYITKNDRTFDFPQPTAPDTPWVQVTQNGTFRSFYLYAEHYDFRRSRAVGVAFITSVVARG